MEKLYKFVADRLKTVSAIKHIDIDSGQLDRKDPALKYPCSLVKLESVNKNIDESGSQEKSWTVTIRSAFDATGNNTHANQRDEVIDRSLAYLQAASDIYATFQGLGSPDYELFECISETQDNRDGYVIFKHIFKTSEMVFK